MWVWHQTGPLTIGGFNPAEKYCQTRSFSHIIIEVKLYNKNKLKQSPRLIQPPRIGTRKWWLLRGISYSRLPFSASMFSFKGVSHNLIDISFPKSLNPWFLPGNAAGLTEWNSKPQAAILILARPTVDRRKLLKCLVTLLIFMNIYPLK